jgi:hypothetical protein
MVYVDSRRGKKETRPRRKSLPANTLGVHAGTTSLNGIDLSLCPGQTTETSGQLSAVEELAGLGGNRAQGRAGLGSDAAAELSATEGAVLLGLCAVGRERVGKSADGGCRVHARSVVNGLGDGPLADEADQGSPGSVVESDGGTHFDVRWV